MNIGHGGGFLRIYECLNIIEALEWYIWEMNAQCPKEYIIEEMCFYENKISVTFSHLIWNLASNNIGEHSKG